MNEDDDNNDDLYGDTNPNDVPDGGAGRNTSAGDGLAGHPVDGHPGWRAGAFGSGRGLLGVVRVSELAGPPHDNARFGGVGDPRLMLASNPRAAHAGAAPTGDAYPMPPAYMSDGHGGVQLRPDLAATHPKGPLDFGAMAHNIDWGGVVHDLGDIVWKSLPARWLLGGQALGPAGTGALPDWGALAFLLGDAGKDTLDAQNEANKPGAQHPEGSDRATNGLP